MEIVRFVLDFPKERTGTPVVYKLVKDYNLIINILKARITPEEEGRMVIELNGEENNIEAGLNFLAEQGISVKALSGKITLNIEECIHCGLCTGVCRTGALSLNSERKIMLLPEKCTLCELCVGACPLRIIKIEF